MAFFIEAALSVSAGSVGALLALALCVCTFVHWWKERQLVGGPPSWPFIGATLSHLSHLDRFHDYITHYNRRFKTFRVAYPSFNYFYTTSPDNVEHLLKTNFHNYAKGKFAYEIQQEFLGNGIFSVDGTEWRHQRKTASYEFASKALRDFCEVAFRDKATKLAKFLMLKSGDGKSVEMQDAFLRLTFDSYSKIGFGYETAIMQRAPPAEQLSFVNAFDECNAMVFARYVNPFWKLQRRLKMGTEDKLAQAVATLDRVVYSIIKQRKEEAHRRDTLNIKSDLLSRFLALGEDDPHEYSDKKLRDIILNFMIAGRDTTALTLSWFFYALCKNPHVQEKIVEELLRVEPEGFSASMPSNGCFPSEDQIATFAKLLTYEKLNSLHYLQACLQEALRLYPPVPLDFRVAQAKDTYPDGTTISEGDCMVVAVYAMGRMSWLWGEDAEEFKPERFMKDGVCQQESPFKLPAFWGGPRMCLGNMTDEGLRVHILPRTEGF